MAPRTLLGADAAARGRRPRASLGARLLSLGLAALVGRQLSLSFVQIPSATAQRLLRTAPTTERAAVTRAASEFKGVEIKVKTVSETIADFYKAYPQPPLLPLFRPFIVDFMTTTHLTVFDSRFSYDAVFALGVREYFMGLMAVYDTLSGKGQADKIWSALCKAIEIDPDQMVKDAEAAQAYAKSTASATILAEIEAGSATEPMKKAFEDISGGLYSTPYGIGIFKIMEFAGVELQKSTVETWAKALKIPETRIGNDLDLYRANLNKLSKAQELLRDNEIREKKKLAEKLEEKAKALAAKAAAKTAPAAEEKPTPAEETKPES
jgi:photosystem II biogenesis protein Psp29